MSLSTPTSEFDRLYHGLLFSLMSWDQLDAFWQKIDPAAGWCLYAVGEPLPEGPASAELTARFIKEVNALLRADHHEDYCGIVYADDLDQPHLIKIYDPNNLGSSCGGSGKNTPPPGWIMSLAPPSEVPFHGILPAARRRWWQAVLAA